MKIKVLFLIGLCMTLLLLASCQNTRGLSSSSTEEGQEVARLIDRQDESGLSEVKGMLQGRRKGTATPRPHKTREAATPTPTATPSPLPIPSTSTPLPTPTAPPIPSEPPATPTSPVTVSDAQIYPDTQIARTEFVAMVNFSSTVNTRVSLTGFFIRQGQAVPDDSTCGQIPEASLASPSWNPPPISYGPGNYNYRDWGYLPGESVPGDATHFVIAFAIKTQPDNVTAYCMQKVLARSNEAIPGLPDYDATSIKVNAIAFWPNTAVVGRGSTFDFGARLDFESIIMNQVRLLAFFLYQGQEIPGESACMSRQMPGRSGEVFWSTGTSTRFWTGTSRFDQAYTYQAEAPVDATHLVMWLMLDDSYNRPIVCWQKVIELSPASP